MYELIGKITCWVAVGAGAAFVVGGIGWVLRKMTAYFMGRWIACIKEWTSIPVVRKACKAIRSFKASNPSRCPFCGQAVSEAALGEGDGRVA